MLQYRVRKGNNQDYGRIGSNLASRDNRDGCTRIVQVKQEGKRVTVSLRDCTARLEWHEGHAIG